MKRAGAWAMWDGRLEMLTVAVAGTWRAKMDGTNDADDATELVGAPENLRKFV